jgi:MSHA biogenesis protein MshP
MSLKLINLYGSPKQQQGFLLPLAIFIVVVMGIFALVLSRNTIQSNISATQEAISMQAFYAAESGAQLGMQGLFFPTTPANNNRQQVDGRCNTLATTPTTWSFALDSANDVPGLNGCTVVVACACKYQDAIGCAAGTPANYTATAPVNNLTSFYTITSTATCGTGTLKAERTIEAGSFLKQE